MRLRQLLEEVPGVVELLEGHHLHALLDPSTQRRIAGVPKEDGIFLRTQGPPGGRARVRRNLRDSWRSLFVAFFVRDRDDFLGKSLFVKVLGRHGSLLQGHLCVRLRGFQARQLGPSRHDVLQHDLGDRRHLSGAFRQGFGALRQGGKGRPQPLQFQPQALSLLGRGHQAQRRLLQRNQHPKVGMGVPSGRVHLAACIDPLNQDRSGGPQQGLHQVGHGPVGRGLKIFGGAVGTARLLQSLEELLADLAQRLLQRL